MFRILHVRSIPARALLYLILLLATSHLAFTLLSTTLLNKPDNINLYNTLGVTMLWPELGKGSWNSFVSAVLCVGLWCVIFGVMMYHEKKQRHSSKDTPKEKPTRVK